MRRSSGSSATCSAMCSQRTSSTSTIPPSCRHSLQPVCWWPRLPPCCPLAGPPRPRWWMSCDRNESCAPSLSSAPALALWHVHGSADFLAPLPRLRRVLPRLRGGETVHLFRPEHRHRSGVAFQRPSDAEEG